MFCQAALVVPVLSRFLLYPDHIFHFVVCICCYCCFGGFKAWNQLPVMDGVCCFYNEDALKSLDVMALHVPKPPRLRLFLWCCDCGKNPASLYCVSFCEHDMYGLERALDTI